MGGRVQPLRCTSQRDRAGPTFSDGADRGVIEQLATGTLLNRGAKVEEIGDVIAFLASPKAAYITGAIIAVDSGRTAV
jgi:NAD(P)-dependent dehydrogenase (short-subunit alcohol dehydrogenase family)